MNERIKELVDNIWAEEYWINPNTDKLLPAQLNRFAELIVRECVGVAADQRDWVENMAVFSERDEFWNKARIVQSQRIVDKIKQHFGVK